MTVQRFVKLCLPCREEMVFFPIVGLRGEIIKEDLRRKLVGLWNEQVHGKDRHYQSI